MKVEILIKYAPIDFNDALRLAIAEQAYYKEKLHQTALIILEGHPENNASQEEQQKVFALIILRRI